MNIGFIGIGKLGSCLAGLLSKKGFGVQAFDKAIKSKEDLIKSLRLEEPGLPELKRHIKKIQLKKNLLSAIESCRITFICVDTPSLASGEYDTSSLFEICKQIQGSKIKNKILAIICTTNPGDCDKMQELVDKNNISIVYTPEFIAQGSVIKDLSSPDVSIYGGKDLQAIKQIKNIYKKIYRFFHFPKCVTVSSLSAEIIKISINAFLTNKITFANSIGQIMYCSGAFSETKEVLNAIGSDKRVGNKFLKFGFGFGGPCLPRDNKALQAYAKKINHNFKIGETIDSLNGAHEEFLFNMLCQENKSSLPFYFDTLSYKKNASFNAPSQKKNICEKLIRKGFKVYLGEKSLDENLNKKITLGKPSGDFFDASFK